MSKIADQLVIDPQSRFLEMKSVQPYSTTDEYLYAMKEDLADWLSNMYPEWRPITAENFLQCLESGVLLCQHANNVNNAARKAYSLKLINLSSKSVLENCKYRSDARPQTFNARDNVSQFIKWARRIVGVREVLMFESDDLILRKNEKNFLLCLLEIARYGSQFGVSVPAIIKLEDEIEQEIQRDKQTEIMSFTELRRLQREENHRTISHSSNHGKYSKLLKFVRNENSDSYHHQETTKNIYNTFSLTHSNGASWLRQRISRIPKFTHHHNKKQNNSGESNDNTICSDITATSVSNSEQKISRTLGEIENQENEENQSLTTSSQLHKTVVQMTNSCSCAQRFPVIRIGEGKYRIGESGTIIFIRILRYHVMVRVGGGWDTLENYLNKHDPCRRLGHRRLESNHHHNEIPILAVPTQISTSNLQKMTPFGKSVTLKTEEFPLSKPTNCDTNLTDAQLIITRDADGRHHIGQITYKSEENLYQQHSCCHYRAQSPPVSKVGSVRGTGHLNSSTNLTRKSLVNIDQDYSSYGTLSSLENKTFNLSTDDIRSIEKSTIEPIRQTYSHSNKTKENKQITRNTDQDYSSYGTLSSLEYKTLNLSTDDIRSIEKSTIEPIRQTRSHSNKTKENKQISTSTTTTISIKPTSTFSESIIDNIDDYTTLALGETEHDFDISDIDDVMKINNHNDDDNDDKTHMDEDSLESCEGVIENKKKRSASPPQIDSIRKPVMSNVKVGSICTALYLAQKQKQMSNYKNSPIQFSYARSNTLPNVVDALKKEEQKYKNHRKSTRNTRRSKSTDIVEKTFINDTSKLDRDSGFDEQDFRCERLHSSYDDNSSVSSIRSQRSSIARSLSTDLNGQPYRENKAYELRLKALDYTRILNEQSSYDSRLNNMPRNFNYSTLKLNDTNHSTTHRYRKNNRRNFYLKQQQ